MLVAIKNKTVNIRGTEKKMNDRRISNLHHLLFFFLIIAHLYVPLCTAHKPSFVSTIKRMLLYESHPAPCYINCTIITIIPVHFLLKTWPQDDIGERHIVIPYVWKTFSKFHWTHFNPLYLLKKCTCRII